MPATGRSYTQIFLKVQYINIQAILSRKSMKKIAVADEKLFHVYKAFEGKNNRHADMRTTHSQLLEKVVSMERKTPKIKFCHKRSTTPVKKSR